MARDEPSLASLEVLVASRDVRDRAFAASALRLQRNELDPAHVAELYERVRATARAEHAEVRARVQAGKLDRHALLAQLRAAPLETRDHLLEELLDIAYPPLDEWQLPNDAVPYSPSGVAEVLFALESAPLGPHSTFVDLGSGLGKVVLLVALLSGAQAHGVELDPRLVAESRRAAAGLALPNAQFSEGDIRVAALPPADAYYMFTPVPRPTDIARRLASNADRQHFVLFAPALDLQALPWLAACNRASYWLEMYETRRRAKS
jgi:protein-L-isoaspartate O-methyltransferase